MVVSFLVLFILTIGESKNTCYNAIQDPSFEEFENVAACDKDSANPKGNAIGCGDKSEDGKIDIAFYQPFGPWYAKGSDFEVCTLGNTVDIISSNQKDIIQVVKDGRQAAILNAYNHCSYFLCQDVKDLKRGKTYTLTFFSKLTTIAAKDNFEVTVNGKNVLNVAMSDLTTRGWEKFFVDFRSRGKDTICFHDVGDPTDGIGAVIDQVELCA
eukprot:TRINITY_DN11325_c0_g1_i1.p1 TRINITY_DN11325_c0_g1~~TRINITY_DN11325_c0_g1_i1.p1  ORF type:complete len:212 (-),score=25.45 TRINITY_DN11325_c0_g1_i1:24-659(-)